MFQEKYEILEAKINLESLKPLTYVLRFNYLWILKNYLTLAF